MQSIKGKIAWVTGAGTGIGRAGAIALAKAGANVILSGRRAAQLEAVARSITDAGGSAEIKVLDIIDAKTVDDAVGTIVESHGRLDILVNSAGLNLPNRRWRDITNETWNTIIKTGRDGLLMFALIKAPTMVVGSAMSFINSARGPLILSAGFPLSVFAVVLGGARLPIMSETRPCSLSGRPI